MPDGMIDPDSLLALLAFVLLMALFLSAFRPKE